MGDGVCSEGVGGRPDSGGGVREGGTGRKREAEGCRRTVLPGPEVELLRESDVAENEVITVGDGRPLTEVFDPFEPAETPEGLEALGRDDDNPAVAPCAPGESRADGGGLNSLFPYAPESRRLATRFRAECSSSWRPVTPPLAPSAKAECTGELVRDTDFDPDALGSGEYAGGDIREVEP